MQTTLHKIKATGLQLSNVDFTPIVSVYNVFVPFVFCIEAG